jgi:hypothetical protein
MNASAVLDFDCLLGRQGRMKTTTAASADSYSAFALVRRLVVDEALSHWRRYALALALMGVAAGATAFGAYLIGTLTNQGPFDLRRRGLAQLHRQRHCRQESTAHVRQAVA